MKKINDRRTQEVVLEYLKRHLEECIYMAIDLERYGYQYSEVEFWYTEKEDKLYTVLMKYYDSFQIFSSEDEWNDRESIEFMKQYHVRTICGKESIIKKLEKYMKEYDVQYGIIVREDTYRDFRQFEFIRAATPADAEEIAKLMCMDEDFRMNYSLEGLTQQLADRMNEGMGRSYVIVEDDQIVAHSAIYAECDQIAVESGLIVHEDYKKKLYGMIVHEFIKKVLLSEGKVLYGFRIVENMRRNARALDLNICGCYGKMTRKG